MAKKEVEVPRPRDKAFSRRFTEACDSNPHIPQHNFGRLTWVRDNLLTQMKMTVSLETVRKWAAGYARPRPDKMKILARLLQVDEAWLSLGITPEMSVPERQAFDATAPGAVNVVAGLIQLHGGHPAFPEAGDTRSAPANLTAIIRGKAHAFYITLAVETDDALKITVPKGCENLIVLAVVLGTGLRFDVIRLDAARIEKLGNDRGGYIELSIRKDGTEYATRRDTWEKIKGFKDRL